MNEITAATPTAELLERAMRIAWRQLGEHTVENFERRAYSARMILTCEAEAGRLPIATVTDALAALDLLERIRAAEVDSNPTAASARFEAAALDWIEARPSSPALGFALALLNDASAASWSGAARELVGAGVSPFMLVSSLALDYPRPAEIADIEAALLPPAPTH